MTINNLERVLWRVRKECPNRIVSNLKLQRAIMRECGTDIRTYYNNKRALKKLGWIKIRTNKDVILTDNDLQEC